MRFFEELHCKVCLQLHGAKFDSSDVKKHLHTFLSCHVTAVKNAKTVT